MWYPTMDVEGDDMLQRATGFGPFVRFWIVGATLLAAIGCASGAGTGEGDGEVRVEEVREGDGETPASRLTATPFAPALLTPVAGMPAAAQWDGTSRRTLAVADWEFAFDDGDEGLDGAWYESGKGPAAWVPVAVPSVWDLAVEGGFDRQTVGWYRGRFSLPDPGSMTRVILHAVFREARVWLNGEEAGSTDLPYLPLLLDVTDRLVAGENLLVIRVDNRLTRDSLPCDTSGNPGRHGWFPYGGLPRPVEVDTGLPVVPGAVRIDASVDGSVVVRAELVGRDPGEPVRIEAAIHDGESPLCVGEAEIGEVPAGIRFEGAVEEPRLWSPEAPENTFRLTLTLTRGEAEESWDYDFSFKRFEARDGAFFLNGQPRFLRGMNRHEDSPATGNVLDTEVLAQDVALLLELGVDIVRPAHYPNDVRTLRALEEAGIMLAEEIPVYQLDDKQMADPVLLDRARRALQAMILRDFNRPGIVMWSLWNENHGWEDSAVGFTQQLRKTALELDTSRPLMVAMVTVPFLSQFEKASGIADVVGINEYYGWYHDTTDLLGAHLDLVHELFPGRTLFVSEYGCGALRGRHAEGPVGEEPIDDHSYSEEYQVWFHQQHVGQMVERPFIRGIMPWVLADFRMQWSPSTGNPHPKDRTNLKGLVSETREKKLSFDFIRQLFETVKDEATR
jgi:beta-glucuronidase